MFANDVTASLTANLSIQISHQNDYFLWFALHVSHVQVVIKHINLFCIVISCGCIHNNDGDVEWFVLYFHEQNSVCQWQVSKDFFSVSKSLPLLFHDSLCLHILLSDLQLSCHPSLPSCFTSSHDADLQTFNLLYHIFYFPTLVQYSHILHTYLMVSLFQTITWWWPGTTCSSSFSRLGQGLTFDKILPFILLSITLVLCISMIVLGKILQWFAIALYRLQQVVGMVSG